MGDVAEMMLDGTLCQCCGDYLEDSPGGFPMYCPDCAREAKKARQGKGSHPKQHTTGKAQNYGAPSSEPQNPLQSLELLH
jgi:predicted amidophosphoribosyltransferase